ncbi:response regulator [Maritalea mediterranea]|uniref:Response regulator n=1 Tax=Maritalea mediterranea TaxID=2909667 RepID=A0ABS9E4V3_9HYPH|nr:response regulator [Maritalea mediterranea]MCF4097900.1 response regulator [Maritalea mediterranea]
MFDTKVVGILTQNSALSSILSMVLRDISGLRLREFSSAAHLLRYADIAPLDLLILDYQLADRTAPDVLNSLRKNPNIEIEALQTITMIKNIDRELQASVVNAGIDEIIVKPMSPAYIKERVSARLGANGQFVRIPTSAASSRDWRDEASDNENRPTPIDERKLEHISAQHDNVIEFAAYRDRMNGLSNKPH